MTTLQEQARALGDPTRHRIFRYLADADAAVNIRQLTEHFGFHHNAIRQHLAKLVDADLVVEDTASSHGRPGRPRLVYTVHPAVDGRWGVSGPYERLTLLLSEMLRTGDTAVEVGRRAGLRQRLGTGRVDDPVALMATAMERNGFNPVVRPRRDGVEIVLRSCPFATTALVDPDTVCGLHLGIARGLAELTGGSLVVDELIPNDPRRANCRLRLHVDDPQDH